MDHIRRKTSNHTSINEKNVSRQAWVCQPQNIAILLENIVSTGHATNEAKTQSTRLSWG